MDLIGPKFACSTYDEPCDGQWLLSTSPIQLDLENAATSRVWDLSISQSSRPAPGTTIKYCDSPYHIIFTNVKTKSQTYGQGAGRTLVGLLGEIMDILRVPRRGERLPVARPNSA